MRYRQTTDAQAESSTKSTTDSMVANN